MDPNPYESPRGTMDAPGARSLLTAKRIRLFLMLAAGLVALYFIYDTLNAQLFILARPTGRNSLPK